MAIQFIAMFDNQNKSTDILVARLAELEIVRDMTNYLSYPKACENSIKFKGAVPISYNVYPNSQLLSEREVLTIRDKSVGSGRRIFYKNQIFNKIIKIHLMQLVEKRDISPNTRLLPGSHPAYLRIDFKRIKLPINSGFYSKTHFISLDIEVGQNGIATKCAASREKLVNIPGCPSGEFLTGVDQGKKQCGKVDIPSCPPGQFFTAITQGKAICGAKATAAIECPPGQTFIQKNGKMQCMAGCPAKHLWHPTAKKTYQGQCYVPNAAAGYTGGSCTGSGNAPQPFDAGSCKYRCEGEGKWTFIKHTCQPYIGPMPTSDRFTKLYWKYLGKEINVKYKNKMNLFELHTEAINIFQQQQRKIEKIKKRLEIIKNK